MEKKKKEMERVGGTRHKQQRKEKGKPNLVVVSSHATSGQEALSLHQSEKEKK